MRLHHGSTQNSAHPFVIFHQLKSQDVSLAGNGESLVSDGRCKHYTKPTHTSHSRTRDLFSRGSRLESIESGIVVSHKIVFLHFKHCMSHAPSLLFPGHEHYFTFHMDFVPNLLPDHLPDFIVIYFTQRSVLRRSIECVFRSHIFHTETTRCRVFAS